MSTTREEQHQPNQPPDLTTATDAEVINPHSQGDEHETDSEAEVEESDNDNERQENDTTEDDVRSTVRQDGNATPKENDTSDDKISRPEAAASAESAAETEGGTFVKERKGDQESAQYGALPCPVSLFIAATALTVFTDDKLTVCHARPRKSENYKNPLRYKRPKLVLRNLCGKHNIVIHHKTKPELSHSLVKCYSMNHHAFYEDLDGYYDMAALKQAVDLANSEYRKAQDLANGSLACSIEDPSDVVLALFQFAQCLHLEPKTEKFSFYNILYPLDKVSAAAAKRSNDSNYFYPSILPFLPKLDEHQIFVLHPSNDTTRLRKPTAFEINSIERAQDHHLAEKYPPVIPAAREASPRSMISDGIADVDDKSIIKEPPSVAKASKKQQKHKKRKHESQPPKYDDYYSSEDQSIEMGLEEDEPPLRMVDRLREKEEEYEQRSKALAKATEFSKDLLKQAKELEELGMSSEVVDKMKNQAAQAMKEVLSMTSFPESAVI